MTYIITKLEDIRRYIIRNFTLVIFLIASFLFPACTSGGLSLHNDNGPQPDKEKNWLPHKMAVIRIEKIAGNRGT